MSVTLHKIIEEAQQLSPQERINVADALIKSAQTPDTEISKSLIEEIEKSIKSFHTSERLSVYGL